MTTNMTSVYGPLSVLLDPQVLSPLLSAIVAVLLTFLIAWAQGRRKENALKKSVALLLYFEIREIARLAKNSLARNPEILTKLENDMKREELYSIRLTDMDYPRTVFDAMITNLGVLPNDVAHAVSDVYRGVEICNHARRLADGFTVESGKQILSWNATGGDADKKQIISLLKGFIGMAKVFLEDIGLMQASATKAMNLLAPIAKVREVAVQDVGKGHDQVATTPSGTAN